MSSPPLTAARLRELLRGFPGDTIAACEEFHATGADAAFDRAVHGIITHHLSDPPAQPVATLPGTTALVAGLGLDSITMVEMVFLFEDLFAVKLPQEEFIKVVTLDDLRRLLRTALAARNAASP